MVEIGSQRGDRETTPLLRQFYTAKNGEVPTVSLVKVIFPPKVSTSWGLITEAGYRVNVYESSPLHGWLTTNLDDVIGTNEALAVRIDDGEKAHWTLITLDSTKAFWTEAKWGYKVEETKPIEPKKRASKTKQGEGNAA